MAEELIYRRRSEVLVDPSYQFRFVTRLLVIVLVVALASAFLAMAIVWRTMYRPDYANNGFIIAALVAVALTLLIELVAAIPLVMYLGIQQSHRVVGPLRRIIAALERIGAGDCSSRLAVRPGDALAELAEAVNRMAEQLEQRLPPPR